MKSSNNDDESTSEPCSTMCGICPTCAFAPDPPGSTRFLWSASDEFKRKFITGLILRCTSIQVLRNVQDALSVTSWSLFTYARSNSQTWRPDYLSRSADRALHGKPLGTDVNEIWDWFTNSPDWTKSRYLLRLLSFCDSELLRMVANLSNVLLVRQKRGFLQSNASSSGTIQHDQDKDEDSEDPELMVVPGASKSMSGVKRYVDFISCLPVDLSSRILGLLDIQTLRRCQKVCQMWQYLAQETLEEIKFRRNIQEQIKATMVKYAPMKIVDPTYANVVDVPIPLKEEETVDQSVQKVHFFESPYAKIPTKTVQMEERNVYCGTYFTTVLLKKEDPYRVLDYRGGSLMAVGSKDRALHLLYVGTEIKVVTVLKGHVGSIRAVLLCEDRDLVITASCDSSIRCWSLKTDRCLMMLYGHTGTVNCLDVHADKLVSGAKDRLVKVWSLQTGKHNDKLNFKHPGSVRCVRINSTTVYSSCERGMVKVWDLEKASLLRVIDAHRSSVKCLFLDEWHFLSGDVEGQVMAWSVNSEVKPCLMTFKHPKEVKSLTLVYLRMVTGCADGKIRVFNFLTGDCLKTIPAEAEIAGILSMHFHDNGILVNSKSSIKHLQFAKVFFDYTAEAIQGAVVEKSTISPRKHPDRTAKVASPGQKVDDGVTKEKVRAELPYHTCILCTPGKHQAQEKDKNVKPSVARSEKATSERIEERGPHHPLTQDSILLKVSAIQRAQCRDEVSVNMEHNASLRDFWGPVVAKIPQPPQLQSLKQSTHTHRYQTFQEGQSKKANTCVPMLKRAVSQDVTNATPDCVQPHGSSESIESSEAPLENKREGRNL